MPFDFIFSAFSAATGFDGAGSPNATATITRTSAELVAPYPVWFEATGLTGFTNDANSATYNPYLHDMTFIWTFEDEGSFSTALNIPTAWDDRNVAFEAKTAHVFRSAGTYTVTLYCFDKSGNWSKTTTSITVADPDTVYAGTRTICYAADSDFTDKPAGAQEVSTIGELETAITGLTESGRVLFRKGSTTTDFSTSLNSTSYDQNITFGAWGTGNKPVIKPPKDSTAITITQHGDPPELKITGLRFEGGWDPTAEVGSFDRAFSIGDYNVDEHIVLIHDVEIKNMVSTYVGTLKNLGFVHIVSDTLIQGWQDYGLYGQNQFDGIDPDSRIAVIGTSIEQDVNACRGNAGSKIECTNQHGPIRYESTKSWVMRSTYLFSNNSWPGGVQPCFRTATRNSQGYIGVDRVTMEGGTNPIDMKRFYNDWTLDAIFNRVLLLGTADTTSLLWASMNGVTVRNSYGWVPNVPRSPGITPGSGLFWAQDEGQGVGANPMKIYNTTVAYLVPGTDVPLLSPSFSTLFSDVTEENNLHHAPNQNTPTNDDPDMTGTIAGVTPKFAQRRESISKPSDTADGLGNTLTFSYPTDGQDDSATSSSDYNATTGRHRVREDGSGTHYYREDGDFTVTLGGSDITITKASGNWPSGTYYLNMDYLSYAPDTSGASPATVPLPRPLSGEPHYESATTGERAAFDLLVERRPGTVYSGAPSGNASKGAVIAAPLLNGEFTDEAGSLNGDLATGGSLNGTMTED